MTARCSPQNRAVPADSDRSGLPDGSPLQDGAEFFVALALFFATIAACRRGAVEVDRVELEILPAAAERVVGQRVSFNLSVAPMSPATSLLMALRLCRPR